MRGETGIRVIRLRKRELFYLGNVFLSGRRAFSGACLVALKAVYKNRPTESLNVLWLKR